MSGFGNIAKHILRGKKDFPSRVIILCALGGIVWWLYGYVGNKVLRPIAVGQVEHFLGGKVEIDSVDFKSRTGAVRLNYLVVGPEQVERYDNRVLRANKVDVRFSFLSVLMFKPKIKSILMKDYIINVQYDSDSKQWNLGMLDVAGGKGDLVLPNIKCRKGIWKIARITSRQGEKILESDVENILTTAEIDWELKPVRLSNGKYTFYASNHRNGRHGA